MHDPVLLHIGVQIGIGGEFKEFPQHADGHRETEGNDGQKQRGQLDREPFASVEDIHQGKPDGSHQKAGYRVQHGVPIGNLSVIRVDCSQDFSRKDEAVDDGLKDRGQVDAERAVNDHGDAEQQ